MTWEPATASQFRPVPRCTSPARQAVYENVLVGATRRLLVGGANCPEGQASRNFPALRGEPASTEDRIQAARRFYNANVRDLNTRIEVFPSNFVAGLLGFRPEQFFEIEEACARQPPRVDLGGAS